MTRLTMICTMLLGIAMLGTANATLLSYDGFAAGDYTEGPVTDQPYAGSGYAAGGTWNTDSDFAAGGMTYPGLLTTDGVHVSKDQGDMQGFFDLTPGGPFGAAGLIGADGNIGGTDVTATIYFSVLARKDSGEGGFAGFQLWDDDGDDDEGFGVGQVGGTEYKWFQGGGNNVIGDPGTPIVLGETHFFVAKLDYDGAGGLTATAWIDPDTSLSEGAQAAGISSIVPNSKPEEGFTHIRMRGNNVWSYDEARFGTTWEDVTPVPEPTSLALGLLGLTGMMASRFRRRRR